MSEQGNSSPMWSEDKEEQKEGLKVKTTMPDELLRHNISDEELQVLADMRRDHLWEGMWVALGIFLGFIPTVFSAIKNAYFIEERARISMSGGDLIQVILFAASFFIFALLCYIFKNKGKSAGDLVDAIRKRTAQYSNTA